MSLIAIVVIVSILLNLYQIYIIGKLKEDLKIQREVSRRLAEDHVYRENR